MRVVFCVDGRGKVVRASASSEKVTGEAPAEIQGIALSRLFSDKDRSLIDKGLQLCGQKTAPYAFQASLLHRNGLASCFQWHIKKAKDSNLAVCTGVALSQSPETNNTLPLLHAQLGSPEGHPQLQHHLYVYLDQMSDGLLALDKHWNYTYVNKKAGELLDYAPENLLGLNIWDVCQDNFDPDFYQATHLAMEKQQYTELSSYYQRVDKWFERRIHPTGNGLLIFFSDISEKKLAEQQVAQAQKELLDLKWALNASTNASIMDAEGNFTWVNDNFCSYSGYSREELIGQKHGVLSSPFVSEEFMENMIQTFKSGQVWRGEIQNRTKDGSTIWVHSTIVPILDQEGKLSHNIIFCQDITEKKKAEKELRESEKLYRTLIENYSDAVFLADLQGRIIKANQKAEAISSLNRQQLKERSFLEFLSPADLDQISTAMPMLLEGKNLQLNTVISAFNIPFSAVVAIVPIRDEGHIKYFFVKFRDISKKVDYEKDLNLLNDASLALSTSPNLKTGTSTVIRLLCKYGNFQYGEFWMPLYGQKQIKMKSSWWSHHSFRIMQAASEYSTYDVTREKPEIFGSGKWHFSGRVQNDRSFRRKAEAASCGIKSFVSVPVLYRGQLLGAFCLFSTEERARPTLDVNKLQELLSNLGSELERRNSAEELDRFFALSPELLGIMGFDGKVKKNNAAFEQLLGYSQEEINQITIRELVHPDDLAMVSRVREQMLQGRSFKNLEVRYRCKDGSYRWLSCATQPIVEENLYYLTAHDISQQKQQMAEIERIKVAIDSTADAIGIASSMEEVLYTNKSFEKMLGWHKENINALGWPKIFVQPDLPYKIVDHMSQYGYWEGDLELYDTSGNIRDFNLRANTFKGTGSQLDYLVGVFTDISTQKQAQREVLRLNKAVEESANEVYIYNSDTLQFTYTNKRAQQSLGYTAEEFEWLTPVTINPEYQLFSYKRLLLPLLKGKIKSLFFRSTHLRKNGSSYPAEVYLSWVRDGATNSFMAHVIDISEQRKTEEALLLSNERYRLVTRATNDAIWDWDVVKQICYYGEGYKTLFGHSFGNSYAGMEAWANCIHPEDAERVLGNFHEMVEKGIKEWVIEYRFSCTDGSYKFVKDRGYVIYNEEGKAMRMAGALSDISDQKRSESLLREFNAELEKKVDEKTSKLGHALRLMRQEVIARIRTEESLQASLQEKEVLLKEIHHRVKNNMAIISGLLSLQTRYVKQDGFKAILKDSQSRIKSMALIHELLYQNDNLAKIRFKEYIHKLTRGISHTFQSAERNISLLIDAEEQELDIVQAVPCGLILNELITNSYKYAFKGKQKGEIKIGFKKAADTYELSVRDNGTGFPADFDWRKTGTLGMQLVNNLARQIGGEIEMINAGGVCLILRWGEQPPVSAH